MFQFIIYNPENLRPVDVTIPNEDGDSLYTYCEGLCEDLESKGKHVASLMFDDYDERGQVMRRLPGGERQLTAVNWIARFRSVTEQRDHYVPRHLNTENIGR